MALFGFAAALVAATVAISHTLQSANAVCNNKNVCANVGGACIGVNITCASVSSGASGPENNVFAGGAVASSLPHAPGHGSITDGIHIIGVKPGAFSSFGEDALLQPQNPTAETDSIHPHAESGTLHVQSCGNGQRSC